MLLLLEPTKISPTLSRRHCEELMGYAIAIAIGGLWLVGRISRGFRSHPANFSRRVPSPFAPDVQSDLLDTSSVSDDTAQESGSFVAGETDDYAPPQITAVEQAPAGINESLKPQGGQCCGGPKAPSPIQKLPVPGRAPGTRPVTPRSNVARRAPFFKFPPLRGRSIE